MTTPRYRPRRRLLSELLILALVLLPLAATIAVFPFEAVGFAADEPTPALAACRFVTLLPAELAKVKARSRSAWQVGPEGARQLEADLLSLDSVGAWSEPVLALGERTRFARDDGAAYELETVPPALSVAAPPPEQLSDEKPDCPALPFSEADLLQLK